MSLNKITYSPGDVLTSDQMNKIQDAIITAEGNIETHLSDSNPHNITPNIIGAVPKTRTVNGKPLSGDVVLNASDVNASPSNHTHTAVDVGAFSTNGNLCMGNADPIMYPSAASKATRIRMYSGQNATFNGGAGLILTNKESTSGDAGNFSLNAHDGTNASTFTGKPDGTLTWRGNNILHAGNISSYALPLDGSVQMKGNINIKKGDSPAIKFENTDTNREMWFLLSSNDNNISISNRIDNDHQTLLIVSPETVAAVNLLRLYHVNGSGSGKFYNVFHTGNVTAGTTDLAAGSSALTTDAIYQVYE